MSSPAHPAALFGPPARSEDLPPLLAAPARRAPRTAALCLSGTGRGSAQARAFTEHTLGHWRLDHCRDDALSIVSELVANALTHARPDPAAEHEVWLRLTLRTSHLVCAVSDPDSAVPTCRPASDDLDENGRGLRIVDALSEHWGWTRRALAGKTVWAMLPTRRRILDGGDGESPKR
ncbi:ATP-binding protein [Streptomyces sp. NPDC006476]|uniref:ATP-binding protein n=1 Tax=Streptomyces sp. NPDC006476 TaxID=3157175 RepID=UPI00339E4E1C